MPKNSYSKSVFRKVLVPFIHGKDCTTSLTAASLVVGDGQVILIGLVRVPRDKA